METSRQVKITPSTTTRVSRYAENSFTDFTSSIADLAGSVDADSMIAATAIEHNLVLVTGNTKHFERIQELGCPLRLDNWRST